MLKLHSQNHPTNGGKYSQALVDERLRMDKQEGPGTKISRVVSMVRIKRKRFGEEAPGYQF
jgi:hypothetical protein